MEHAQFNDDVQLDRLVDGELTDAERRRLLESFDQQPEGWRRCALAFLQAQSWREGLGQLLNSSPSASEERSAPVPLSGSGRTAWQMSGVRWLALAASLLVAFGLGSMQNFRMAPLGGPVAINNDIAVAPRPAAPQTRQGKKTSDELTLYVRDNTGHMQPVHVPLVDAGTLDDQLGVKFQPGMPDAVRDQFKNHGYSVESKQQYAPLWLENGRPMIVPVEDTKIVPVSDRGVLETL